MTQPPLEDDRTAMMLGLVPDQRTPEERLLDAIRTKGESVKFRRVLHLRNQEDHMTLAERVDEIDKMLFDASVSVLRATTPSGRAAADRKITDARIELDKLRSRVE